MESFGQIIVPKEYEREIKNLLDSYDINHSDILMFSTSVEIVKIAIDDIPWGTIATVLCAYIGVKAKRKVIITFPDNTSINFQGYSPKEIEELMKKHKQYYLYLDEK